MFLPIWHLIQRKIYEHDIIIFLINTLLNDRFLITYLVGKKPHMTTLWSWCITIWPLWVCFPTTKYSLQLFLIMEAAGRNMKLWLATLVIIVCLLWKMRTFRNIHNLSLKPANQTWHPIVSSAANDSYSQTIKNFHCYRQGIQSSTLLTNY